MIIGRCRRSLRLVTLPLGRQPLGQTARRRLSSTDMRSVRLRARSSRRDSEATKAPAEVAQAITPALDDGPSG